MSWIRIWKKSKKYYGWRHITRACDELTVQYSNNYPLPVKIVALARGGLVPATILANKLGVRHVYSLGVSSYEQQINGTELQGDFDVYQRIPTNITKLRPDEFVLVVDDISDKGTTFTYAEQFVKQTIGGNVVTMSVVVKPETKFIPDLYHQQVEQDTWVVFPWEK